MRRGFFKSLIFISVSVIMLTASLYLFKDGVMPDKPVQVQSPIMISAYQSRNSSRKPVLIHYPIDPAPGDFLILEAGPFPIQEPYQLDLGFPGDVLEVYKAGQSFYFLTSVCFDAEPGDYLASFMVGDEEPKIFNLAQTVRIAEKEFPLSRFSMPAGVTEGWTAARLAEDREKVRIAREETEPYPLWNRPFLWPLDARVSSQFGAVRIINENPPRRHMGIDLAADEGEPIIAINCGTVRLAEFLLSGGYTVIIDHGVNLSSTYMHLHEINVEPGQRVSRGDLVGTVGMTGYATGPHLHFEVNLGQTAVNPEVILSRDMLLIPSGYIR